ncbi:hypothetical protein M1O29_02945 [Dehalococcoidia bacterium]|nr:hypothetical protein [Dehalococcoidia bacterium]
MSPAEVRRISKGDPASLIDRRKPSFKALGIGDRSLNAEEAIDLMRQEPSIIRRPIFEIADDIIIGFNQQALEERL